MKKESIETTLMVVVIVLMGALILSCGNKSAFANPGEIPKEIRIGDLVSYTGPYAGFGFNSWG